MSLFAPVALGDLHLANRMVMAPLSRARADATSREALDRMAIYYGQRASAGLIVSEATHVSPYSVSRPGGAAIHSEAQMDSWRQVTRAVHERGGLIVQQIYHVGRKAATEQLPRGASPLAPSAICAGGEVMTPVGKRKFSVPREIETHEIPGIVAEFQKAARFAVRAGFDGVEIHAANGYLIDQFLRSATNHRIDQYGGVIERRARCLLEVGDAVARGVGKGRVGVRLSPAPMDDGTHDSDPTALFSYVAHALGVRQIAYLHLVEDVSLNASDRLSLALKRAFGGPLILCGGFTRANALDAIEAGLADCIAFGTLYVGNPDLVERFRAGAPLNRLRPEFYREGGDEGYIDYPFLSESNLFVNKP